MHEKQCVIAFHKLQFKLSLDWDPHKKKTVVGVNQTCVNCFLISAAAAPAYPNTIYSLHLASINLQNNLD
jgi:hypothetical protein